MKKYSRYVLCFIQVCIMIFVIVMANDSINEDLAEVTSNSSNRNIDLTSMAIKVQEDIDNDIYSAKDTFTGDLTGYAHDCPLCGGTLGCLPSYNVRDRRTTYPDKTYGNVRIVASSKNLPCGSVVRFNVKKLSSDPIYAIVLDRGVLGNDLDLLMPTEDDALKKVGRVSITYDVVRFGWN